MHCVFTTKERRPFIKPELQNRLWPYLGGIARENKMRALIVGGVEDHVHLLLSIPSTLSTAKSIQLLKGNSSKWIHDTFHGYRQFE
jgi:REP element-mobilizing transposase RayT